MNTDSDIFISNWAERLMDFMARCLPADPYTEISHDDETFNRLALELWSWQTEHNPVLNRLANRLPSGANVSHWTDIPALPAVGFKEFEVTCIPPDQRTAVFCSSGTTGASVSRHYHHSGSLALYERSSLPWFKRHLAPSQPLPRPLFLTPPAVQAEHSSLVHMFESIHRHTVTEHALFAGFIDEATAAWQLHVPRVTGVLELARNCGEPIAILGTAFNFVQLLEAMEGAGLTFQLPAGSRVMETGGYKGRARSIPKQELYAWIGERLGVPPEFIVGEYGMSELSSQAYDAVVPDLPFGQSPTVPEAPPTNRAFQFPPWARARIVSPENGREVSIGETGSVQICDLANAWSSITLQTEDLGVRHERGFSLLGRRTQAEPKGCSLHAGALPS